MFLKTWSESGTPAGAVPCAEMRTVEAAIASQHAVPSAKDARMCRLVMKAPTAYLAGRPRADQSFHVALLHNGLQRATAFDHFSCEPFEDDCVAGLQIVWPPALAANG